VLLSGYELIHSNPSNLPRCGQGSAYVNTDERHPIFDDMSSRLARLKGRRSGEAHPFVIGAGAYGRFWNVVSECIQAEIARRGDG
jgi:hypothetical protein